LGTMALAARKGDIALTIVRADERRKRPSPLNFK